MAARVWLVLCRRDGSDSAAAPVAIYARRRHASQRAKAGNASHSAPPRLRYWCEQWAVREDNAEDTDEEEPNPLDSGDEGSAPDSTATPPPERAAPPTESPRPPGDTGAGAAEGDERRRLAQHVEDGKCGAEPSPLARLRRCGVSEPIVSLADPVSWEPPGQHRSAVRRGVDGPASPPTPPPRPFAAAAARAPSPPPPPSPPPAAPARSAVAAARALSPPPPAMPRAGLSPTRTASPPPAPQTRWGAAAATAGGAPQHHWDAEAAGRAQHIPPAAGAALARNPGWPGVSAAPQPAAEAAADPRPIRRPSASPLSAAGSGGAAGRAPSGGGTVFTPRRAELIRLAARRRDAR
eukprot:TRINITY_DN211_c4_g1_i1.p1 TRINITY_DN211_c4_g1~~TRINITY_DN211_c4_g1_i1.p1  ORF type:complete len:371 (+),score=84.47 TRINITY_DN211_c4_g1_i1:61-1113(+)